MFFGNFVADNALQIGFTAKYVPVFCFYTKKEKSLLHM